MVIYKTTNLLNGKIYVGKKEHDTPSYLGSGYILKKAIEKHGKENFKKEILQECYSSEELEIAERYWIKELDATNPEKGYNIAEGGNGGNTYVGKSEEEMHEIKKKISEAGKGRVFSEEHRKKLAESARKRKGNKPCKFKGMRYEDYMDADSVENIKNKLRKANIGKSLSEEQKRKIGEFFKGRKIGPMSEEHKENLKKSFIARDEKRKESTKHKNIEYLDSFLKNGINEENVNHARRIYQRVRSYGVDMNKYEKLLEEFRKIEFLRRSRRKQLGLSSDSPW
jgi:group I intron endonuclease